jgi:hypothetical protein
MSVRPRQGTQGRTPGSRRSDAKAGAARQRHDGMRRCGAIPVTRTHRSAVAFGRRSGGLVAHEPEAGAISTAPSSFPSITHPCHPPWRSSCSQLSWGVGACAMSSRGRWACRSASLCCGICWATRRVAASAWSGNQPFADSADGKRGMMCCKMSGRPSGFLESPLPLVWPVERCERRSGCALACTD